MGAQARRPPVYLPPPTSPPATLTECKASYVNPAQDTNDSNLAPQPDHFPMAKSCTTTTEGGEPESSTTLEGGESKSSTTTHDSITNSDGILLAAEPCAGGAPPDGACSTEDGDTLHKVAS